MAELKSYSFRNVVYTNVDKKGVKIPRMLIWSCRLRIQVFHTRPGGQFSLLPSTSSGAVLPAALSSARPRGPCLYLTLGKELLFHYGLCRMLALVGG